jgi:hypothetical protein
MGEFQIMNVLGENITHYRFLEKPNEDSKIIDHLFVFINDFRVIIS